MESLLRTQGAGSVLANWTLLCRLSEWLTSIDPFSWRYSECLPAPHPMSKTLPLANFMALCSQDGHSSYYRSIDCSYRCYELVQICGFLVGLVWRNFMDYAKIVEGNRSIDEPLLILSGDMIE